MPSAMPEPIQGSELLWEIIKEHLRKEVAGQSYLTWFDPITFAWFDGSKLVLNVPNNFHKEWIVSHYANLLQGIVHKVCGNETAYELQFNPSAPPEEQAPRSNGKLPTVTVSEPKQTSPSVCTGINPEFTFDKFIEGECNRFARAAALAVAENPGKTTFNPLLIYGSSGLGKTHLIHAIGNSVIKNKLAQKVTYVTSEKFTADFIRALQSGSIQTFSQLYRNTDLLLVDDVQFFMTKDRTQEEFFHTFNALRQEGKQLVFSSDRPARELEGFDERLISRLQWGLVSELKKPDIETRLAIITHMAEIRQQTIPPDVALFIAEHVTDNIRSVEGAVTHITAQASLLGSKITIEMARESLRNFLTRPIQFISVEKIQEVVAEEYNISCDLLRSKTRKSEIVSARQMAMYLTAIMTNLTLEAIGLHFGGRDHATVIHAKKSVIKELEISNELEETVDRLTKKIKLSVI